LGVSRNFKPMTLQTITLNVLTERLITQFDSKKLVNWAVEVILLGYESENLFILAGLDNELTQIREEYFWKTIKDLNISIDKTDTALIQNYAKFISKKVINDEIDIKDGFKIMLEICSTVGYERRYIAFYEINEDIDCLFYNDSILFNPDLTMENKNKFIKEEFKIFYEMEKHNIPLEKRNLWYCKNCESLDEPKLKTKYQFKKPYKYQTYCCSNCNSRSFEKDNQKVKRLIIEKYK